MITKQFRVSNQHISDMDNIVLVAGAAHFVQARFDFSSEWTSVPKKYANFTKDNTTFIMLIDDENEVTIPFEMLSEGTFALTVTGGKGDKVSVATDTLYIQVRANRFDELLSEDERITSDFLNTLITSVGELVENVENGNVGGGVPSDYETVKLKVSANTLAISNKADIGHKHTVADITDFPTEIGSGIPADYDALKSQVNNNTIALGTKANISHTHSYNDLSNKPNIPSVEGLASTQYVDNQLQNKANRSEIIKSYNNLSDLPTIPSIEGLATEQSVTDLAGRVATLESGIGDGEIDLSGIQNQLNDKADKSEIITSYNDLTDKPTIITSYNDLEDKPTIPNTDDFATRSELDDKASNFDLEQVRNDLNDKASNFDLEQVRNSIPNTSDFATRDDLNDKASNFDLEQVRNSIPNTSDFASRDDLNDKASNFDLQQVDNRVTTLEQKFENNRLQIGDYTIYFE